MANQGKMIDEIIQKLPLEEKIAVVSGHDFMFTNAKCEYLSKFGKVASEWIKDGDSWRFCVEIPSNCKATFVYPNGEKTALPPGGTN